MAPHQLYWEQQSPKDEPEQVKPEVPAQVPSVETLPPASLVGWGAAWDVVAGAASLEPQLPKPVWHPVPQ